MRRALFGALLALATLALIAAFGWPGAGTPWTVQQRHELPLEAFTSSTSEIALTENTLRAEGADARGALQLNQDLPALSAAEYRYFSFDVDALATVSKLMLSWQGSEGRGMTALPDAPWGRAALDLSQVPAWKGTIASITLIAAPTDYLALSGAGAPPLVLRQARFESPNWPAALCALWSQWSAYRPWMGRSSNTGGMELGAVGPSLQAFVMSWLVLAWLATLVCFGRARARAWALPLIVGACTLLALWQLRQLGARAIVAEAADDVARPESPLAAHPQLAQAAQRLSQQLDPADRVLVFGPDRFLAEYPTWLLRNHDVATLPSPELLPAQAALEGYVLVLVGKGDWDYTPESRDLRLGTQHRSAEIAADVGVMKAYRFFGSGLQ